MDHTYSNFPLAIKTRQIEDGLTLIASQRAWPVHDDVEQELYAGAEIEAID
jgi:hypothetical protein